MFDTNKVAGNIRKARTKLNMTQMNLADEMGVSYQAVSNWERGNSMPDISKLPELCKILNISFEELVSEKNQETETVEKLMQDEKADVSLEEMAPIGQLVQPDKMESKIMESIEKGREIPFSVLVSLAPFMDTETLSRLAEEIAEIDLQKFCALAPFLKRETLDAIAERAIQKDGADMKKLVALAPFLSKSVIQNMVEYLMEHDQAKKIVMLAPFMGKEMFPSQINQISLEACKKEEGASGSSHFELDDADEETAAKNAFAALEQGNDVAEYLDDMNENDVAVLAVKAMEAGKNTDVFLDYMNEDDIAALAVRAMEAGKNTDVFLDYMNEDDIAVLAVRAMEAGKNTDVFLDYMTEDDVAVLASRALEAGKPIEGYLDYMDEDAIKEMLLKLAKK